jgi:branched-chain amino acid transport system substrate-binding protein
MDVLETLKGMSPVPSIWGGAKWWGKDLWGIDNALVGNWPVVQINDGKARIQEFGSILDWWDKHSDLMLKDMRKRHLLYNQRA